MSRERRERLKISADLLAVPPARRSFPEWPLRRLPRPAALALLAVLVVALAWSAWGAREPPPAPVEPLISAEAPIGDFELYARIAERVAAGERYYPAALAEHRANNYPVRPFVTVRLPTLAWANAATGRGAMGLVAFMLLLANLFAWYRALAESVGVAERIGAVLLVFLAGFAAFEPRAGLVHELVAGLLISLALALYRPGFAGPALVATAAALAMRELALPYALLWLGLALYEKRGTEARALAIILALFAAGLVLHSQAIAAHLLPDDRASPGWGGLAGPRLFLDSLIRFTPLVSLPNWLAGPLALLPLVGWIGLGGRLGVIAALWFAGFALVVALLAREANFYWVLMVLPAYFIGLALVPRAVRDLGSAALGSGGR